MVRRVSSVLVLLSLVVAYPSALSESGVGQRAGANRVGGWLDPYRANTEKLIAAALADQFASDRLAELTDTYGQRISGSDNLNRAIAWAQEAMKKDGLENVHTERVMVPKWVRGNESLEIVNPPHHVIPRLGLGGSVATPAAGVEADVIVVSTGEELTRRAAEAKGKIVVFNVHYTNYGETVAYRSGGASMAARVGAVASLVRSVGPIAALGKVPMLAYSGDAAKNFTIHHTPADTVDRIDPQEVAKAAASLAAVIYIVADMSQNLPKDPTAAEPSAAIVNGSVAIYATLSNPSMYDAYVQSATSDAGKAELRDGDKPAANITIPSFGSVELKAGGPFVLVSGLEAQPKLGDTIKVTLQTDGGVAIAIAATIR